MKLLLVPLLTLVVAVSCSHKKDKKDEMKTDTATMTMAAPTDAEIANAVMTANTEEMNMAKLAKTKAHKKEVRDFANMMFKEHSKNNDKAIALAKKNNLMPKETMDSNKMKITKEDKVEKLKQVKGKDFDKAYMQEQVSMHREVLNKIDNEFLPNAQNQELKTMLQETRGKVEEHLKHAEKVSSKL